MSVERTRQGTYLVRQMVRGKRRSVEICTTREDALDAEARFLAEHDGVGGITLREHGKDWLDRRELDHVRNIRTDRGRWTNHIVKSNLIDRPLTLLTSEQIDIFLVALRRKRTPRGTPLSSKTLREVALLLRQCMRDGGSTAADAPVAALLRAQRRKGAPLEQPWTFLDAAEQHALLACPVIPESHRLMIAFALLTGLRQGEQFNLELRDLHLDSEAPHVYVRFGARNQPPKNGRPRRVYLTADALAVARRWVEVLPSWLGDYPNTHALVFPGARGGRVSKGKTPLVVSEQVGPKKHRKVDLFVRYTAAAKIDRHVRWHDLRHTCASSLVAGWWGRRWSLEEVREHLGHRSLQSTQRYAHLGESAIKAAVSATNNLGRPSPPFDRVQRAVTWPATVNGTPSPTLRQQAEVRTSRAPSSAATPESQEPQLATELPADAQKLLEGLAATYGDHSVGRQGLEPWTYGLKALRDLLDAQLLAASSWQASWQKGKKP
jgi:integrase